MAIATAALVASLIPGASYASPSPAGTHWHVSARLYTLSHGRWRSTTSVDSLGDLRGVLAVRGQELNGNGVTATMQIMHLSWRGFKKVIMPPAVVVRMRRVDASRSGAVFAADVQVPTLLPVYWSVVRFTVSDGHARAQTTSGVMVGGPAKRTASNSLTVSQAHSFCAAHSPLPYLSYAVYLHGYFVYPPSGSDGPPRGIVLDRPRHVTASELRDPTYPHGVLTQGFGLPRAGWGTTAGLLSCASATAVGFGAW